MGFFEQRLLNTFPSWAKIRKDPSSYGNRFMSALAGFSESSTNDIVKLSEMLKILAEDISFLTLQEIILNESDYMNRASSDWVTTVTYPTVTGTIGATSYKILKASSIADFFFSIPDRITGAGSITVDNWVVWESSSPDVFKTIDTDTNGTPERLLIEVYDSTLYQKSNTTRAEDNPYYGTTYISLTGTDEDNNQIREYINIKDDGFYNAMNIFRKLTSVEWCGFNGKIKISLTSKEHGMADTGRIIHKFDTGVLPDLSGPLALYLQNIGDVAHLKSTSVRYRYGRAYRRNEIVDMDEAIEEELATQRLLDSSGNTFKSVGMTVSPVDTRGYILDVDGKVHVYEMGLSPFLHRGTPPSDDTFIDILSLKDRVKLDEKIPLWTWFRALVLPVQKVAIKRVKPDGVEEYLQSATMTWAAAYDYFSGNIIKGALPENSWEDFRFYTTFDQLGQWDFYCETTMLGIKEVSVISKTGVMCERATSVIDFDSGLGDNVDGIFFDKENYLCISVGSKYHKFALNKDVYLADVTQQKLIFRERYDEVDITYA
tara:strand:- start:118 stop:1749 length:1632 start_codon:yes stop_codon:yes gene_type:complete